MGGSRNECVDYALRELERFGLKGEVHDRGKHLEVTWTYPNGVSRFTIVPRTHSDHRAPLNARGEVRRLLRSDNIEPPPPENVLSFKHAMSLPKPQPVEPPNERIRHLEDDLTVILDWVVELRAAGEIIQKENEGLKAQLAGMRVTVTFGDGSQMVAAPVAVTGAAPAPVVALKHPHKLNAEGPSARILALVDDGAWKQTAWLVKQLGLSQELVGATLQHLRRTSRVENGQRGWWRKKPVETPAIEVEELPHTG